MEEFVQYLVKVQRYLEGSEGDLIVNWDIRASSQLHALLGAVAAGCGQTLAFEGQQSSLVDQSSWKCGELRLIES